MGIDWRNLTPTIYERLAENKLDSVIYYNDSTMASTFNGIAGNPDFFGSFDDDFLPACADNDHRVTTTALMGAAGSACVQMAAADVREIACCG